MSFFLTYSAENEEYLLQPAGYLLMIVLFAAILFTLPLFGRSSSKSNKLQTRQLVYCSGAMALAMVTSFIKFAALPFGGSITLFSMLFICLIGYVYGVRAGIMTGVAYGILQFITEPYIFAPLQVLLDYPLAFGALGLSGLFRNKKHGLVTGYTAGVAGRYLCHVVSGYIFFASYTPEGMNPMIYTLGYNATYILPELIVTVVILYFPPVLGAIGQVKRQAVNG
ncbi:energy-coupled thiamine transporter ThiT [Lacrimispora saccharolytica]|uniref:Proton-coupled thiamine transporter YuaJ n=1 Tax=Lacrimispora saccharolytica (strain ATCC 35040 / DSM 2544 / NRCC 2533 / WM1) TaxID=610130 RepID=D9R8R7_LACSW|nr:energy-coupled thiamine transporter ThiT [Lacrimispora saccharolytica]ADL05796.1 proton-coupled thiamine transporter YuaJ [[Clostridium] saccharolyticum WM1]QRV20066.1 energy-coupled thiamine transporter ThiT [Lacrimispora saccharolytica]